MPRLCGRGGGGEGGSVYFCSQAGSGAGEWAAGGPPASHLTAGGVELIRDRVLSDIAERGARLGGGGVHGRGGPHCARAGGPAAVAPEAAEDRRAGVAVERAGTGFEVDRRP